MNMAYTAVDASFVVVYSNMESPTANDWDAYFNHVKTQPVTGVLIYSAGGTPNSKQRRDIAALAKAKGISTVVLTRSAIARGAITALSWLGAGRIKGFEVDDLEGAVKFLGKPELLEDTRVALKMLAVKVGDDKSKRAPQNAAL